MNQISPIASVVPYMTSNGNHERDYPDSGSLFNVKDSGGECGIPYESRFKMIDTDHQKQWYSFDYGNVHIMMMSTEHEFAPGSEQYKFIVKDLSSVNRKITPWLIFTGHRPMYVDSTNNEGDSGEIKVSALLRNHLEDVLVKYKVDLAMWGHHHSYQRTCHVYQEECGDDTLPVHAVIGMSGFYLDHDFFTTPPNWIEVASVANHGYATITANSSKLVFHFIDESNVVKDELILTII